MHEERGQIEQNAVDKEGPPSPYEQLAEVRRSLTTQIIPCFDFFFLTREPQAVIRLAISKGIITQKDLLKKIEEIDNLAVELKGRDIVVEAWTNPEFKQKLLKNARQAIESLGITVGAVRVFFLHVLSKGSFVFGCLVINFRFFFTSSYHI